MAYLDFLAAQAACILAIENDVRQLLRDGETKQ